uniref:Uncharacterized protein n=1 Tax=Cacopsylla melanoneura TaxID=428564 RepID=A0A8D8XW10_9HEMI
MFFLHIFIISLNYTTYELHIILIFSFTFSCEIDINISKITYFYFYVGMSAIFQKNKIKILVGKYLSLLVVTYLFISIIGYLMMNLKLSLVSRENPVFLTN